MRTRNFDVNPVPTKSDMPTRMCYGLGLSAGGQSWASSDVTCVRIAAGNYNINFNPPFDPDTLPIVVATPYGGQQYVLVLVNVNQRQAQLAFATSPGGAGVDTNYMFMIIGQTRKKA